MFLQVCEIIKLVKTTKNRIQADPIQDFSYYPILGQLRKEIVIMQIQNGYLFAQLAQNAAKLKQWDNALELYQVCNVFILIYSS